MKTIFCLMLALFLIPTAIADELPVLRTTSSMSFDDMNGNHWSEAKLKNKVTVINFFFASCKNVCPVMNRRLREYTSSYLQDSRFQILSITVDPENDTVQSLKEYAHYLGDHPYWFFLRAPIKNVENFLVNGLGIGSPDDISLHTTRLTLVDGKGQVRAYISSSDSEEMEKMPEMIQVLVDELPK